MTGVKEKAGNGSAKAEPVAVKPSPAQTPTAAPIPTSPMTGTAPPALFQRFADDVERIARDFGLGFGFGPLAFGEAPRILRRSRQLLSKGLEGLGAAMPWAPRVEVKQSDDTYIVAAELPGIDPKEIKVEVTEGVLTLHGERSRTTEKTDAGIMHSECIYGAFWREIPIPEGADLDKAAVTYSQGVLTVTIPVPAVTKAKTRRLEIRGA